MKVTGIKLNLCKWCSITKQQISKMKKKMDIETARNYVKQA